MSTENPITSPVIKLPDHSPAMSDDDNASGITADGSFSDGFNEGFQI
ncbi:hypothetical protein [Chitinophaga sp.]|nr:hypothetical protein [Chitinophaga sp.]HWV67374.1 hypothetical protein [Chitinophaga sp.]